ncbi:MAG: universal stress protein [Rickettsiales bacterium]|nr:universal stress protein [Rickettsiales bacterium]
MESNNTTTSSKSESSHVVPSRTKYLVCVNDNDHSRIAVRFAYNKAARSGCIVELLTIVEPADFKSILSVADKIDSESREMAQDLLQSFVNEAANWGLNVTPSLQVREGNVSEEIMNAIEEDCTVGMVILGTSATSPGKGTLLPKLAGELGSRLLIPMLIVPSNLTDHQIRELT